MPFDSDFRTYDVLLLEDEKSVAELYLSYFRLLNLRSQIAQSIFEANTLLNHYNFQVAIIDLRLPDGNGLDFIRATKERGCVTKIIATSALLCSQTESHCRDAGAGSFLIKPFGMTELKEILQDTLPLPLAPSPTPASINISSQIRLNCLFLRTEGEVALDQEDSPCFTKTCHQLANEAFGHQIHQATTAFSEAEEAARNLDWSATRKFWQSAWLHLDPHL